MMTEQGYQRNLIRMFDCLRTAEYKGDEGCSGIRCTDCPFYEKVCKKYATDPSCAIFNAHEAIKIVEQWAEEHPFQTNAEKFKEVFGFEPNVFTDNENHVLCNGYRTMDEKFWKAEYEEKAKGVEENRK
ncbi:MAG: hypothetical protein K5895_05260 [Lachnospiraceae bacterium]|nr:hypothetical protein [Lachnospiraceae bacterium]